MDFQEIVWKLETYADLSGFALAIGCASADPDDALDTFFLCTTELIFRELFKVFTKNYYHIQKGYLENNINVKLSMREALNGSLFVTDPFSV